jgi:hypothetical protein
MSANSIEPRYHFQKQIPLDYFSLGRVLSYANALNSYRLSEAHADAVAGAQENKFTLAEAAKGLAESNFDTSGASRTTSEASRSASEASAETGYWADKAKRAFERGREILLEQSEFFKGVASTQTMLGYNTIMRDYEQQSLNENESGEGHMDRMIALHDSLSTQMLGYIADPKQRARLKTHLNELGIRDSGRWFHDENQYKLQFAVNRIQESQNETATRIAKGMSLEDALLTMNPVYEALPASMGAPQKERLIMQSQSELANHSALCTALKSPVNAQVLLQKSPLYQKLLNPQQQLHIESVAQATLRHMSVENAKMANLMVADEASREGTELNDVIARIATGEYRLQDIVSDERWQNRSDGPAIQRFLTHYWERQSEASINQTIKTAQTEQTRKLLGNYAFLSNEEQQNKWAQHVASTRITDPVTGQIRSTLQTKDGKLALTEDTHRELLTYAEQAAEGYTAPLKALTNDITAAIKYKNYLDAYDGICAYAHLKVNRPSILGGMSEAERLMCDQAIESMQHQTPFGQLQSFCRGMLEPVSKEWRDRVNADYKESNFNSPFNADYITSMLPEVEGDIRILTAMKQYHKKVMLYSKGDASLADRMTVNEFRNVWGPTKVNGLVGGGIMKGAPETLVEVRSLIDDGDVDTHRGMVASAMASAVRIATSDNLRDFKTHGFAAQDVVVEPAQPMPGQKFNPCNIHTQSGTYFGCYWLEQLEWGKDAYRVKYTLLPAPAEAGGYTTLTKHVPESAPESEARQIEYHNNVASDIDIDEGAYMTDINGDFITVKATDAVRGYMNRIKEGNDMLIAKDAQATFGTKLPEAKK